MKRMIYASLENSSINTIKKNMMIYDTVLQRESDRFFLEFDKLPEGDSDGYDHLRAAFCEKFLPLAQKCEEIVEDIDSTKPYSIPEAVFRKRMYKNASEIVYNFPYEWKAYTGRNFEVSA